MALVEGGNVLYFVTMSALAWELVQIVTGTVATMASSMNPMMRVIVVSMVRLPS
jgi:hypothetical protein